MYRVTFTLWLVLALGSRAIAQKETASAENAERHQRMLTLAKSYEFSAVADGSQVVLRETPLFSWTNPEVQSIGGELYLWTVAGKPFATIGIWTYDDIKDSHELQSLATERFSATSPGGATWLPIAAGLNFNILKDSPVPAASAARRLTQMRNMIRERFSGEVVKRDTGEIEKLRILPQPLYRYDPLPGDLVDGAIFSLAFGTDPEILVLFEARRSEQTTTWYYALAPATSRRAAGFLDGKEVWNSEDQVPNRTFLFYSNR